MASLQDDFRDLVGCFHTHLKDRARYAVVGVDRAPSPRIHPEKADPDDQDFAASDLTLPIVRGELGDCTRCKLSKGRKNIVFGTGDPNANLMFVGEGPGADEDAQGEPFVGAAGQLLTKMIKAMGYARSEVYIANVIKCRPPQNRNPEEDEIAACAPFLRRQIEAIRPRVIVALGKFAAQFLCGEATPITRLRGNWKTFEGIPCMPTYHPAYLLRDESKKGDAWADLKQVMAHLAQLGVR